jgi:hypothetical protein
MTKHLHYVVPIFLIGLIAGAAPASAAVRSDGGTRDPIAAPAESTDAPIILAQRGGGRGGGGGGRGGGGMRAGGGGGGMRAGGGGYAGGARGGYAGGGANRSAAAGSRNWSGVSASNRSVNAGNFNRTNVNTANVNRNVNVSGSGYGGGYYGGAGWGGVAAGVAAGAVVGAAATAVATPNYYPAPAAPCCPYGTVKLAACGGGRGRVAERDDSACLPQIRRPPVSGRGHQPRGLALLPLPAQPAHGRGDAGRARHHRQPRDGAAVGAQVRPGVRQPDPAASACDRRQMASR